MSKDMQMKADFLTYPEFCAKNLGLAMARFSEPALPKEVYQKIRRVIVTGSGDSYAAALATQDFCGRMFAGRGYYVMRCIDVSRHFIFPHDEQGSTLVVVISASGSGARASEAVLRAAKIGCTTLAITSKPDSRLAQNAHYSHLIDPPQASPFSPASMTKSYFSTALALLMFGLVSGMQLGTINLDQAKKHCALVQQHINQVYTEESIESLDTQMYHLAKQWRHYRGYGFTGGGSDFAIASFGSAKFFELCGSINSLNDSEDWCHIDFFQTDRHRLGNVAIATKGCASFSRTMETVVSMSMSGRNVLLVTDAIDLPALHGTTICTLPKAEEVYLTCLSSIIPLVLLPAYIAQTRNYPYFGGMDASNPLFSQDGGINTIKSSKIMLMEEDNITS